MISFTSILLLNHCQLFSYQSAAVGFNQSEFSNANVQDDGGFGLPDENCLGNNYIYFKYEKINYIKLLNVWLNLG